MVDEMSEKKQFFWLVFVFILGVVLNRIAPIFIDNAQSMKVLIND